jgi:ankyrin repeat protein
MSNVTLLHEAVKLGQLERMGTLLNTEPSLANSRSATDARGTYPLHVAAEFDQADAARMLLVHDADPALLDLENEASPLSWAAFFGRPEVVSVLLAADTDLNQRNKHGLTPLGCALGGSEGKWKEFSAATPEDWLSAALILREAGAVE